MTSDHGQLWEGATFMPHDRPGRTDMLVAQVRKARQGRFTAFGLSLMVKAPQLFKESGFADALTAFKNLPVDTRVRLVEYPLFLIWLRQAIRTLSSGGDVTRHMADFLHVMATFEQGGQAAHSVTGGGRHVAVVRFDVDPMLARVSAPEYCFPDLKRQQEFEAAGLYPFACFLDMLTLALARIERTWPEAHRDFFKFVRMIVDMVDGESTSLSADDHTGVIFVSTDNSPLLALEEYLIHEFGHQVLYNVMELDPLVRNDMSGKFTLPWSGSERDFYGYFHAFYIYILMAHYYRRMEARSMKEQKRSVSRVAHVMHGLTLAIPELEAANGFTPMGQQLFENLKAEVRSLIDHEAVR